VGANNRMSDKNSELKSTPPLNKKALSGWRLWGLIFLTLYALFGFFGIPYILKTQMIAQTPEFTQRQLDVKAVQFNPFTLSLTIEGISLADLDNVELVGLDKLHVNFDSFSLFRWAWTFSEISFINPRINLRIDETGTPSFNDLIPAEDGTQPVEPEESTEESAMPRLVIKHFQVSDGKFAFEDKSLATPFNQTINPLNFGLVDFSTLPEKDGPYRIHVELPDGGKIQWQGEISVNPVRSQGNLKLSELPLRTGWRYAQDNLKFSLDSGFLSGSLNYKFKMANAGPELTSSEIKLGLDKVEIRDKILDQKSISLPKVMLTGGRFDLSQQLVHFDQFAIEGGNIDTYMDKDGKLHLAELFAPVDAETAAEPPAESEDETTDVEDSKPWNIELDRAAINAFDFHYVDRNTDPHAEIRVEQITIAVTDITNQENDQFGLDANLKINDEGFFKVSGKVGALPPMADLMLDIKTPPFSDFQAYLNQTTNIALVSGLATLKGKLNYAESEKNSDITLAARLDIPKFAMENSIEKDEVASWKNLTLDGINLKLMPNQLDIDSVTLDQLKSNIVIAKNGEMNVSTLVKTDDTPPPVEEAKEPSESFPISVAEVKLKNNLVSFSDNTVSPRFSSQLSKLKGSIKGLSSENIARADVDLSGRVDDYADLLVTGKINPLSEDLYTDIKLEFIDYNMVSLTPYTGKFIGNAVDKGKLSINLNYLVSENDLKGKNKVLLDQFTLGKKIESKDAVNLPVGMAIALVKDSKGKIDIDVPVKGNLDDPEFKLSGLIFTALGNVVTNIAKSPFKALSKLAGGGEDMDHVLFLAGGPTLLPEHDKRLETLGKVLQQRPQLLLEVRGQYHTINDKVVLQEQKLLAQLEKAQQAPPKGKALDTLDIDILEVHYDEQAGSDAVSALKTENSFVKEGADKDASKELDPIKYKSALLASLIAVQKVGEDELRDLAKLRANTVRDQLVNVVGLKANRIFVLEPAIDKNDAKEGVSTLFTLTAK